MPKRLRLLTAALALTLTMTFSLAGLAAGPTATAPETESANSAVATFAGGCFWCMEPPFDKLDGVLSTTSGYTGGNLPNPTYREVSGGDSGHYEAVQVRYDPSKIRYSDLLETFWRNIDLLDAGGQFCDRGAPYRTGIFAHDDQQRRAAEVSKQAIVASGRFVQPVVTEVLAASEFYPAEEYHQDYYQKNPLRYKYYRYRCGRDQRLKQLWDAS